MRPRYLLLAVATWCVAPLGPTVAAGDEMDVAPAKRSVAEMKRELLEWRRIVDDRERPLEEREAAAERIEAIDDPRMTPILTDMWDREKEIRVSNSRKHVVRALQTVAEAGDRIAFLTVARASIQDTHYDIRRDAAIWVGTQENRDNAIPIYVKYLKTPKYHKEALESLGYTQIPQNPKGPPDPDLVAALIDRLIDIVPVRRRVPIWYDTGHIPTGPYGDYPNASVRAWGTSVVPVYEYVHEPNQVAKELLSQYTAQYWSQEFGYDQPSWRREVLKRLKGRPAGAEQDRVQGR